MTLSTADDAALLLWRSALAQWAANELSARARTDTLWSDFKCGIHSDRSASASINLETGWIHCQAQDCGWSGWSDKYAEAAGCAHPPPKPSQSSDSKHTASNAKARMKKKSEYLYKNANGERVFKVVRFGDGCGKKDFRQLRWEDGAWKPGLKNTKRVLYRLPELLNRPQELLLFVEGEKDVHSAERLGLLATTTPQGANSAHLIEDWTPLLGRPVVIVPDNDAPGIAHATKVADILLSKGGSVRTLCLPGLPAGGDLSDWISLGGRKEQLLQLISTSAVEPSVPGVTESQESSSGASWPEVRQVSASSLPTFPLDIYPKWCRDYLEFLTQQIQVPTCYPGMMYLGLLSIILQGRFNIRLKQTWTEVLSLWIFLIGPPSSRKSPTFSPIYAPTKAWQAEAKRAFLPVIRSARRHIRNLESEIDRLKKSKKSSPAEIEKKESELDGLFVPAIPSLYTGRATTQAVEENLSRHHGRYALASPESDFKAFLKGKHRGESPVELCLSGWSGEEMSSDYVSKENIDLESIHLSLMFCTQPENAYSAINDPEYKGRGLWGRALFSSPYCEISEEWIEDEPDTAQADIYQEGVLRLLPSTSELFEVYLGRSTDSDGSEAEVDTGWKARTLFLSELAMETFKEFSSSVQRRRKVGGDLQFVDEWAGKYAGQVMRIAALLHLCDSAFEKEAPKDVSLDALQRAIRLGNSYLVPHAKSAFRSLVVNGVDKVWSLLQQLGSPVQWREIQQEVRPMTAKELRSILDELERRGFLQVIEERTGSRGPRKKLVRLNPSAPAQVAQVLKFPSAPVTTALKDESDRCPSFSQVSSSFSSQASKSQDPDPGTDLFDAIGGES